MDEGIFQFNEIKIGEDTISSPTKIAECFNDYFVKLSPTITTSVDGFQTNFERYINKVDNMLFTFQTISSFKVFKLLDKLAVSEATGVHKVPAMFSKLQPQLLLVR